MTATPRNAAERLASAIVKASTAADDIRTVSRWAFVIGSNKTSLTELCRVNGVRPRDARDFMRVLRTLLATEGQQRHFDANLDVGDLRTLHRIRQKAGLPKVCSDDVLSIEDFLQRQTFLVLDHPVVRILASMTRVAE
jgi:hypothetical protein